MNKISNEQKPIHNQEYIDKAGIYILEFVKIALGCGHTRQKLMRMTFDKDELTKYDTSLPIIWIEKMQELCPGFNPYYWVWRIDVGPVNLVEAFFRKYRYVDLNQYKSILKALKLNLKEHTKVR